MLASIKSKIIALTIALLCMLATLVTGAAFYAFYHDSEMMVAAGGLSISSLTGRINKEIIELENNAVDLALMGEIYYKAGKKEDIGQDLVTSIFQNYPNSLGGGIWFKPYAIRSDKKRLCIYAFHNEDGQVRLDPSFESAQYNYLTQSWYVEIMEQLEKGQKLFWSKPYYENQGAKTLMTTVGAGIYHDGKLIGLSTVDWQMNAIRDSILNIKPTPNSFVLFADKANNYIIASTEPGVASTTLMGKPLQELNWYSEQLQEGRPFDYKGKKYIPYIRQLDNGLFLIVNVPFTELFRDIERHLFVLLSLLLISTFFIVGILYWVLKRNINGPISKLSQMAQDIGQGNLNLTIRLDKPKELANLASVLNKMTTDIKTHLVHLAKVSHEKEKIESELAIAKTIQASAVPQDFPKDDSVELLASMTPAREVGGDFYDFFPIDEDRFAFVMADVSGKGITAALYMMSAKTAIRNMLQAGYPLVEAISRANKSLYENHARGMFVTAFVGVLNRRTGHVDYISAGHCAPLHKTKSGYDYVPVIRNLMLGVMPTYAYEAGSFVLRPKDRLFLYTDGVTEAQTKEEKLFGPERLQKALNRKDMTLPETLISVRQAIQRFVKGAEQSDDITMMILEFHKKK